MQFAPDPQSNLHDEFARARFSRSIFPAQIYKMVSQENPLLSPWLLSVATEVYSIATDLKKVQHSSWREVLNETIELGSCAKGLEEYEKEKVREAFNLGIEPDVFGAIKNVKIQKQIATRCKKALSSSYTIVNNVYEMLGAAFDVSYFELMNDIRFIEDGHKLLKEKLNIDVEPTCKNVPQDEMSKDDLNQIMIELLDLRSNSTEILRPLLDETLEWLNNAIGVIYEFPAKLNTIRALIDTLEKITKLKDSFTHLREVILQRCHGDDPWYELIEFETYQASPRLRHQKLR